MDTRPRTCRTAFIGLLLSCYSKNFETKLRAHVSEEELISRKKCTGPDHVSWTRRVLGAQIKSHSRDKTFRTAWQHMVSLNHCDLDPFRSPDQLLQNF